MENKNLVLAMAASQLGFCVAGGLLGGLWLDRKFATMPLFGMLGLLIGFASGVIFLLKLVKGVRNNGA